MATLPTHLSARLQAAPEEIIHPSVKVTQAGGHASYTGYSNISVLSD